MICQACGKHPATTHIKTIVNGELSELSLCSECAQKMGYDNIFGNWGLNFGSLLGSFFSDHAEEIPDTIRCKGCGSSFEDIAQSGKVGCAECYHTFYDRLIPSIQRIHGNTKHCGKNPNLTVQSDCTAIAKKSQDELEDLRNQLKEAVEVQNFEQAAVLRDKIKELEGGEQA